MSLAGDRSGGRPDAGRRGLDARGNEFQRIRQESISVALVVGETTVGLVAVALHNQTDGASVVVVVVAGDRGAAGSAIAQGIKRRGAVRSPGIESERAAGAAGRGGRRWRVGLVAVVVVGALTFNRDGSFSGLASFLSL